jgi:hypothetical protein
MHRTHKLVWKDTGASCHENVKFVLRWKPLVMMGRPVVFSSNKEQSHYYINVFIIRLHYANALEVTSSCWPINLQLADGTCCDASFRLGALSSHPCQAARRPYSPHVLSSMYSNRCLCCWLSMDSWFYPPDPGGNRQCFCSCCPAMRD